MGVKYGRGFLRSKNVPFNEMDFVNFTNEYVDIIYIDLLGSFFGYLLKLETQKESTTSTFINWFKNSNVVVVVDGGSYPSKS